MTRAHLAVLAALIWTSGSSAGDPSNLNDLPSDLRVPEVTDGPPWAGSRVWQRIAPYDGWDVAHAVYLPTDWRADRRYPVLFEFPGNGGFKNELGDESNGNVADCKLGYGLTGGTGMIWVSLPFVDSKTRSHARVWWGDPDETARYCKLAAARICKDFGGDSKRLVLVGFSRGAIACNYIGLRDDEISELWCAFLAHSHYDGVRRWEYTDSDVESALVRLKRLGSRPQFISHEGSTEDVERNLKRFLPTGKFTFAALPYPNHSSEWVLKAVPLRTQARNWLADVLKERRID
jgi:hypothetical protein